MAEPLETEVRVLGADKFVRDMLECNKAILKVGTVSETTATQLKETRAPILAMSRAISTVRMGTKLHYAEMLESVRLMQKLGTIGYKVTGMWQAWNIAQMRVSNAQQSYQQASNNVVVLQEELNRLQQQGITSGEEYIGIQIRLNQAKAEATRASNDLTRAQQENIVGYLGMGLQVTGLVANMVQLYTQYQMMQAIHGSVTAALGVETAARYANAAASWIQAKAQAAVTALTPFVGPALVAAGLAAAAVAVGWIAAQASMQKGGSVGETGLYYLHKGEYVIPARGSVGHSVNIGNLNIYESRTPRETANEVVAALRRRGVM